jgi:NADH:ubiquinone oxidoreductase subunit 5 (subunit L)/multisubunit Na+/H+ antiporter MnhA subunit
MLVPLGVLAIPALSLGWLGTTLFELLGAEHEPLALGISAAAVVLGAIGAVGGWRAGASPRTDAILCARLGRFGQIVTAAFRWDELVDHVVVRPCIVLSRALWAWVDRLLIDGVVDGTAALATLAGRGISRLHNGDGQRYATAIAVGVALILAATVMIGR